MNKWMKRRWLIGALVLTMVTAAVDSGRAQTDSARPDRHRYNDQDGMVFAQQGPPGRVGRFGGPMMGPPLDSGVQRRHIEQLRLLKLLEVLDLNEDQEPQFMIAFKSMRKAMRDLDDHKRDLVGRLSEEVRSDKADTRRINNLVDSILSLETGKRDAMQKFVQASRTILTPLQVGRLLVFNEKFEYELLERVREFRERMRNDRPEPKGDGDGR